MEAAPPVLQQDTVVNTALRSVFNLGSAASSRGIDNQVAADDTSPMLTPLLWMRGSQSQARMQRCFFFFCVTLCRSVELIRFKSKY